MRVEYNKEKDLLVYNRKLKDGRGSTLYGLEVCKSMDMDKDFLYLANKIRKRIAGINETIVLNKKSVYNKNLYMSKCEVCGSKENLETHHLKDQCLSDENKFIGHIHQNDKHNIVCLCSSCHSKHTHNKGLVIRGWLDTDNGRILDYEITDIKTDKTEKKRKLTEIQIEIVKDYLEKYPKLSKSMLIKLIRNEKEIKLSSYILKKVEKGIY